MPNFKIFFCPISTQSTNKLPMPTDPTNEQQKNAPGTVLRHTEQCPDACANPEHQAKENAKQDDQQQQQADANKDKQ